jgi:hypothetical protein
MSNSGSQTHIFDLLWAKSAIIFCALVKVFLYHFRNKIIFKSVIFVDTKKKLENTIFPSSSVSVFESGMDKNQDPG